jgi:hypothetical protein
LRGHDIPLGARILAAAGCLATADFEIALESLRTGAGAAFDPDLVELVYSHRGALEEAAPPGREPEFLSVLATAGREERALHALIAALGNSLSLHDTLSEFDAALRPFTAHDCLVVTPPHADGAPWYLSGDSSLSTQRAAALEVALVTAGQPAAVLQLFRAGSGAFDVGHRRVLHAIREKLAHAIENARRFERIERLAAVELPRSRRRPRPHRP